MLIAEHFFLIACDPEAGLPVWPRRDVDAAQVAAAALLLDLAVQRRLRLEARLLHLDAQVPLTHPLLTDALRALQPHAPMSTATALRQVVHHLHRLPEQVLEGLYRRDLVHRSSRRRWLLWRQVRYPLRSVQARNEALMSLQHAVQAESDHHGLALLLLTEAAGLLPLHLAARDHEIVSARLASLNAAGAADELGAIFASIRAALTD